MAVADFPTLYTRVSPIQFSDFTPSRVTRPSSNPFLQEHDPISDLYYTVRSKERSHSDMVCSNIPLKGRYVDVEFAGSYPPVNSRSQRVEQVEIYEELGSQSSATYLDGNINPLCTRKRTESKRIAFRKRQTDDNSDKEQPDGDVMKTMETPTFVVFESANVSHNQRETKCNGLHSPPSKPLKSAPLGLPAANKIRIRKRRFSPPRFPPPPPPPEVALIEEPVESTSVGLQRGDQTTESVMSTTCVAKSSSYVVLHRVDEEHVNGVKSAVSNSETAQQYCDNFSPGVAAAERTEWPGSRQPPRVTSSADSPPALVGRSGPLYEDEECHSDLESSSNCDSDVDSEGLVDAETEPIPIPPPRKHKLLSRSTPSPPLVQTGRSLPSARFPLTSVTPPIPSPLLQNGGTASPPPLSPPRFSPPQSPPPQLSPPPLIGKTRPVPPPRQRSISQADTIRRNSDSRILKAMHSSPALFSDRRQRTASFLKCKAGDDCGQYTADYLGCREVDCYINCVDQVAKQLVDLKAVEVVAYVTSEKVRLAPPNNSALLFKSFAMKDILGMEKCSKNKRIMGVLVWKSRGVPACHILRCPTHIITNTLYDTIWFQSQNIDEVLLSKVSPPMVPSHLPRPPSDITSSDSSCDDNVPRGPPLARDMPLSPTELLHKFPATHIGSAVSGKLHSVNEIIQKVLSVNKPSQAKEVSVWLSLAQVRLVDMSDESEIIYAMHETSRIRAIGVYSLDKRFIGYIIKEVGKPLMGHVLRCNSAGLMVSLMSFLRQSCQITFYQRGGSFYDELSTDDSEDFEYSPENSGGCESPGIIKKLRSLTMSSRPATHSPSFVSHTPLVHKLSPAHDVPQRKRDSIQSPFSHSHSAVSALDFSEEDYAKFTVNYVGSAVQDRPLTQQSILDALRAFEETGVAGGQAAVQKNVIHMQVSSLGINLTDKKHRLFVSRNYPRKQLEGYCLHPTEPRCFAFASKRPGFLHSMRCHVFRQVQEPLPQIFDAIRFWLELEPVVSELDPVTS